MVTDLPNSLTVDWMRDARRDQAMDAIAESLDRMKYEIRAREESFILRHPGSAWDANAERDYRTLDATASFVRMIWTGARGAALEVAKANKEKGKDYHRIPHWITALGDALKAGFCHPIPKPEASAHDAGMESAA